MADNGALLRTLDAVKARVKKSMQDQKTKPQEKRSGLIQIRCPFCGKVLKSLKGLTFHLNQHPVSAHDPRSSAIRPIVQKPFE